MVQDRSRTDAKKQSSRHSLRHALVKILESEFIKRQSSFSVKSRLWIILESVSILYFLVFPGEWHCEETQVLDSSRYLSSEPWSLHGTVEQASHVKVGVLQAPPTPFQVGLHVEGNPARSGTRPGLCKPWAVGSFLFAFNIFNQNYFS